MAKSRKFGNTSNFSSDLDVIDGTWSQIPRPQNIPQVLFFSGHMYFHAIHTQDVVDNTWNIYQIQLSFLGYRNDAANRIIHEG